ncbi:protein DpdG [Micromonospora sp. NPDC049497]|uniref:protein DpdG n=1 Tax=Micromonospora sp. NPDC049497 TaxID=3364273 RepID=UPI0037A8B5B0
MTLLNEPASFPTAMWVVVRYLAASPGQRQSRGVARAALRPASLLPADKADGDKTFDNAVRTLLDLDMVAQDGDDIVLRDEGRIESTDDYEGFTDLLRSRVLESHRSEGVAQPGDQGPKDLVRALACFLTLDAFGAFDENALENLLREALPKHIGDPNFNDVRRNRFGYWSRALGFAAGPLLQTPSKLTLQPDCTVAVRRAARALWPSGARLAARDAIAGLLEALPVLPGGRYSLALDLRITSPDVSSALSFALFCGEEQGWLKFDRRSDADDEVLLVDPDRAAGTNRITHLEIMEPTDG